MSPPACLKKSQELVSEDDYLDVDKHTLRHTKYGNVFGVGDCLHTPNSKTAAAVGKNILKRHLVPRVRPAPARLLTSYKTGVLAEYRYDRKPHETFPFDQSKEHRKWNGPSALRKVLNLLGK
ncbi:hypothetical protein ACJJTC_013486 [Scirpophaga incertulas]